MAQHPDTATILLYYGEITDAAIHKSDGSLGWWTMLESEIKENQAIYPLAAFSKSLLKRSAGGYRPPEARLFSVSKIAAGSSNWAKLSAQYKTVREITEVWLNLLPSSLSEEARRQIRGNLRYDVRRSSKNYYMAFDNWVWGKNAVFFFKPDAELVSIAHETGHYMTQVMCGYNRYMEIYNRIPKTYWGLGGSIDHDVGYYGAGRLYLLEEYAYVSQYLITGTIEGHDVYNLAPQNYMSQLFGTKPDQVDYPSQEGFGAAALLSLTRDPSFRTIKTFDVKTYPTAEVPAVNFSLSEATALLAQGPRDINELRRIIHAALSAKGADEAKKLSALFEPLGWSYHGKVTVVDQDNKPLKGVSVQNILHIGAEIYRTNRSVISGDDGTCYIRRLYPGESELRVYYNYSDQQAAYLDSSDFPISIDWDLPTNRIIDLPKIQVKVELKPEITSVTPDSGYVGTLVFIQGKNFGADRGNSRVLFAGVPAVTYSTWTDNYISVSVPQGAVGTGLWVEVGPKKSNVWPFKCKEYVPHIREVRIEDGVDPFHFNPVYGDTLRIRGEHFGAYEAPKCRVTIGETDLIIIRWEDADILVQIPIDCPAGDCSVHVGDLVSNSVYVPVVDLLKFAQTLGTVSFDVQSILMQVVYDDGSRGEVTLAFIQMGSNMPKPIFAGRAFISEKDEQQPSGRFYYRIAGTLAADYRSVANVRIDGLEENSGWIKTWKIELRDIPINRYSLSPSSSQLFYSTAYQTYLSPSQFIDCSFVFSSKVAGIKSYQAVAFDISRSTAAVYFITR